MTFESFRSRESEQKQDGETSSSTSGNNFCGGGVCGRCLPLWR